MGCTRLPHRSTEPFPPKAADQIDPRRSITAALFARRPNPQVPHRSSRAMRILAACLLVMFQSQLCATRADERGEQPPIDVRLTWGGGRPKQWSGSIAVDVLEDETPDQAPLPPRGRFEVVRTLAADEAANASFHVDQGRILLHAARPMASDGVDLRLYEWSNASLSIELQATGDDDADIERFSIPIDDVLANRYERPLDEEGNGFVALRTPGDDLRVRFPSHAGERCPTLRGPGDHLEIHVQPVLLATGARGEHLLRARLVDESGSKSLFDAEIPIGRLDGAAGSLVAMREVPLVVPMPNMVGGYEVQFSVAEAGGLRWSRPIASRGVAVAVMDRKPLQSADSDSVGDKVVYELDPGSPRLIERLRRLPGMSAVPSVAMPQVPSIQSLPKLPSTGFGLSQRTAPDGFRLPGAFGNADGGLRSAVRGLESLVPRGGGLLAHGYSSLETHPLGPVLRLPPATSSTEPTWEAVAIPSVEPGRPHLIEIDYPTDQRATIAVAVLESDPSGKLGPVSNATSFHVEPLSLSPQPPSLGTLLLPFWPATRSPVVLVANPSTASAAVIGKLRVRAGQTTIPFESRRTSIGKRAVRGVLLEPSFRGLGVPEVLDARSGHAVQTWSGLITGAERFADLLISRRAGGALVAVYSKGSACWPTAAIGSQLWDGGAFAAGGPDPVRKDLVTVLSKAFDQRSLELVPAIDCTGPIAELEEIVARGGPLSMGIECIGPDGAPVVPSDGVRRYNPLDPRVQDAVSRLADDLASHVAGRAAIRSIAIIASPQGWLHLPGTASCLDDATIARFARETAIDMPAVGAERFAERAMLVEGPVRSAWLAWRARRLASFYRRLAEVIAARDGTLDLHVVVTDLPAADSGESGTDGDAGHGELAIARVPGLSAERAHGDSSGWQRLLEAGIAPGLIASHPRVVFISPHVSIDPLDLGGMAEAEHINADFASAIRDERGARLGCITTARPVLVELESVVRHLGGNARASGSTRTPFESVATNGQAGRTLAEALANGDLECFYDGTLLEGLDTESLDLTSDFAAMPPGRMHRVPGVPEPLVVRTVNDGRSTWVSLVNPTPVGCTVRVTATGCSPPRDDSPIVATMAQRRDTASDAWVVSLRPWETRLLQSDGVGVVRACSVDFDPVISDRMGLRLETLSRRRAVLENPTALPGLDNPSFELPWAGQTLPGWELVDTSPGALSETPGANGGKALMFSSDAEVSSLRSNPFPTPASRRVSVAAKIRLIEPGISPPVRIAIEGTTDGKTFYRFADVRASETGVGADGQWRPVVLQIESLPIHGLDTLRVRFDILGVGAVAIDDVRIYGLAFEESQRVQLAKTLAAIDQHMRDGNIGTAARELDGYWPRFLDAFVPDPTATETAATDIEQPVEAGRRANVMDRLRRWWR